MITFNDRLKSLCNFSEQNKSMCPIVQMMYTDMIVEDDETRREVKRKKRNLSIDIVLDEVDEENGDYTSETISTSEEGLMVTISPKIMSINAQSNPFVDDESLYNNLITFLEKHTKQKHYLSTDYVVMNDPNRTLEQNNGLNFRRIVTKIMYASNLIASFGRIGPGTAVIVGRNNWHWFNEYNIGSNGMLTNLSIIFEEKISPNKIIVARGGRIDQGGIICVKSLTDNTFYLKETSNWERQYVWFTVK